MEERFKEFLDSQVKKTPVKVSGEHVAWDEPGQPLEVGGDGVPTGSIDVVYREEEPVGTVTLSKSEVELLRRQITELDQKLVNASIANKVLKVVALALSALTLFLIYLHFFTA